MVTIQIEVYRKISKKFFSIPLNSWLVRATMTFTGTTAVVYKSDDLYQPRVPKGIPL